MNDIYISVDIETDGGCPIKNSMLSIGAAAFIEEGDCLGTFERNLNFWPGATPDNGTMEFWQKFPEAYKATRVNPIPPKDAMIAFVKWVQSFPGRPVFTAYPAGFDFTWVFMYLAYLEIPTPFAWVALDIRTLAMAANNTNFSQSTKRDWPKRWKDSKRRHTHVALDDAIEQGVAFVKILKEIRATHLRGLRSISGDGIV